MSTRQAVLDAIVTLTRERGYPPTVREIADLVGLSSPSSVHAHITALVEDGTIRRDPERPRTIVVQEPGDEGDGR